MKPPVFVASVCTVMLSCAKPSVSQQVTPLSKVIDSVKQNSNALSNVRIRSVIVSVASDDFFGAQVKKSVPSINGKIIDVIGESIILDRPNFAIERNQTRVAKQGLGLSLQEKYYHSSSGQDVHSILKNQVLDAMGKISETVPSSYKGVSDVPMNTLEYTQIQWDDEQSDITSLDGMTSAGGQEYMGLKCLKFLWGEPDKSISWGYKLVAPERSYRVVYSEGHSHSPGLTFDDKMSVMAFIHTGNSWIPSQIKTDTNRINADKKSSSLVTVTKILEVHTDDVSEDLLFDPVLAPGDRLIEKDPGLPIIRVGGDLFQLASDLKNGDFSFLNIPTKPLSTP